MPAIRVLEYLDARGRSSYAAWFESLNASAAAKVAELIAGLDDLDSVLGQQLVAERSARLGGVPEDKLLALETAELRAQAGWKRCGRACVIWVIWKARISSLSLVGQRESSIAYPSWQPNWFASTLTSS